MTEHLVNIGDVIVQGILFDPKNTEAWRTMDVAALYKSVPRLFSLLDERSVDYVLVGGIALLAYVDGRNTQDIDLIVASADLEKLPEIRIENANPEFARGWFGDVQIDFLFTESKLFDKIRRDFVTTKRFADRDIRCATVEGLILMKLAALPDKYRLGQFDRIELYESDIHTLLRTFRLDTKPLFDELAKHMLAGDLDEIRRIVADIDAKIARQSQRFSKDR